MHLESMSKSQLIGMLEDGAKNWLAHDGLWFLAAEGKLGLDQAIELGEMDAAYDTVTIAEMLFAGMLGSSVLYGVAKDNATLDLSIDSLIEYLCRISHKQIPANMQLGD